MATQGGGGDDRGGLTPPPPPTAAALAYPVRCAVPARSELRRRRFDRVREGGRESERARRKEESFLVDYSTD